MPNPARKFSPHNVFVTYSSTTLSVLESCKYEKVNCLEAWNFQSDFKVKIHPKNRADNQGASAAMGGAWAGEIYSFALEFEGFRASDTVTCK